MTTSQNGYSAPITPVRYELPGGAVSLRAGPTGALLQWVGRQFHARVEPLVWPGCWGYNYREIRGATGLSNHASGTALDLNAPKHPLGTAPSANFTAAQIAVIRAIVAATEGCVRWGGDYTGRQDPMHFEINNGVSEARCAAVLAKLTAGKDEDMPLNDADKKWITDTIRTVVRYQVLATKHIAGTPDANTEDAWTFGGRNLWDVVLELLNQVFAANAKLDGLTATMAHLATHPDITPDALQAAMQKAFDDALARTVKVAGDLRVVPATAETLGEGQ